VNRVPLYIKCVDDPVISDARAETSRTFQAAMRIGRKTQANAIDLCLSAGATQ
jgi:hypothetical protein